MSQFAPIFFNSPVFISVICVFFTVFNAGSAAHGQQREKEQQETEWYISQCQCNKVRVVVETVINICVSRFELNVCMSGCFMFEGFLRSAIYVGQTLNLYFIVIV